MKDTYTITVTFTRQLSEDMDYMQRWLDEKQATTLRAAAIHQFRKELKDAYDGSGLGGTYKITDCDLTTDEDAAYKEAFEKKFPALTRWGDVKDQASIIEEFLDWFRDDANAASIRPSMRTREIIEQYFEIDQRALDKERDELLRSVLDGKLVVEVGV